MAIFKILHIGNSVYTSGNKEFRRLVNKYNYVSFGDSIAAGHAITDEWEYRYGRESQYGYNGRTEPTELVSDCYTDLLNEQFAIKYADHVTTTSFAKSGDRVIDLMNKLNNEEVIEAIQEANLVTICIGANDLLEPALKFLDQNLNEYINTGDLTSLGQIMSMNLTTLEADDGPSFTTLMNKLKSINPRAQYVFTTIYNPYKYLWLDEGEDGFFGPLLSWIPNMDLFWGTIKVDEYIKEFLLDTPAIRTLFDRVNGIGDWIEPYLNRLNDILKRKAQQAGCLVADTKAIFDGIPDRTVVADYHYNDLVNVEFTSGFDTSKMNWGRLYEGSDAATWWTNLIWKYVINDNFDLYGLAEELVDEVLNKVIVPDVDPHPEVYGHYLLEHSFLGALGLVPKTRYTVTFDSNGGSGTMTSQEVVGVDGEDIYVCFNPNSFEPMDGYRFIGWNTQADGSGTSYANGALTEITSDMTLYAQWSNQCLIEYKHTNDTKGLYGNGETGHKECYALYINGVEMPDLGTFNEGGQLYSVPYGSRVGVIVKNYNPTDLTYDDVNCNIYWNDRMNPIKTGYKETSYEFTLTEDVIINFTWKIDGSIPTQDAKSWEDCYISTFDASKMGVTQPYSITFAAGINGQGSMATHKPLQWFTYPVKTVIAPNAFTHSTEGYYSTGWVDQSGTIYGNGQLITMTGNLSLTAQWSNMYQVVYHHSNHSGGIYGSGDTGHQECYALAIDGVQKRKLNSFGSDSGDVYSVPYGTKIAVAVTYYYPSDWFTQLGYAKDVLTEIYFNDFNNAVADNKSKYPCGNNGTTAYYEFELTHHVDIDFRAICEGLVINGNAKAYWDCYIREY